MRSMQDVMKPKWITVRGPWDLILIQKGERAPLHAQVQSGIAEPVQNTPLPDFVSTFTTCVVLVSPAAEHNEVSEPTIKNQSTLEGLGRPAIATKCASIEQNRYLVSPLHCLVCLPCMEPTR